MTGDEGVDVDVDVDGKIDEVRDVSFSDFELSMLVNRDSVGDG
jgi:hypothetical protein